MITISLCSVIFTLSLFFTYLHHFLALLATWSLSDIMESHHFHKTLTAPSGEPYNVYAHNPIEHPLATIDRGKRIIDVLTDVSHLTNYQLASAIVNVNDNAINSFIPTIRRRLSILEQPLTTARGEGKVIFTQISTQSMLKWQ
jgi:hypothetical protein